MTISIPDSIKELVDQEVASGAFPTAEDYIQALVEADHKQKALDRLEAQDRGPGFPRIRDDSAGLGRYPARRIGSSPEPT
jgi:Arc/MetJ-type ribon-helix-helix transcriptional regulator